MTSWTPPSTSTKTTSGVTTTSCHNSQAWKRPSSTSTIVIFSYFDELTDNALPLIVCVDADGYANDAEWDWNQFSFVHYCAKRKPWKFQLSILKTVDKTYILYIYHFNARFLCPMRLSIIKWCVWRDHQFKDSSNRSVVGEHRTMKAVRFIYWVLPNFVIVLPCWSIGVHLAWRDNVVVWASSRRAVGGPHLHVLGWANQIIDWINSVAWSNITSNVLTNNCNESSIVCSLK